MCQHLATIFQRPLADILTTILTLWVILCDSPSCGLLSLAIIVGLTIWFHVLLQCTASKCQLRASSKRATSEWLKWQKKKRETTGPTSITYIVRHMKRQFNSGGGKHTGTPWWLIAGNLSHLLQNIWRLKTRRR